MYLLEQRYTRLGGGTRRGVALQLPFVPAKISRVRTHISVVSSTSDLDDPSSRRLAQVTQLSRALSIVLVSDTRLRHTLIGSRWTLPCVPFQILDEEVLPTQLPVVPEVVDALRPASL